MKQEKAEEARESRESPRMTETAINGPANSSDETVFGTDPNAANLCERRSGVPPLSPEEANRHKRQDAASTSQTRLKLAPLGFEPLPFFAFVRVHSRANAFTLLEMLVATAVFSLMIVMLLQLTSGLITNANRVDENLKIDQEVRILFDLMRRDLAQARIGTNQNQFYGTATNVCFVSSSSHLKTNYVSDQRLVTYYFANNTIYRAVVDPTLANYTNNPIIWNPLQPSWWTQPGFMANVATNASAEALLTGVYPYSDWNNGNPFLYTFRDGSTNITTMPTNPPNGLTVGFSVASRQATRSGRDPININDRKQFRYDIELNIPPPFNP